MARGWQPGTLKPVFKEAMQHLQAHPPHCRSTQKIASSKTEDSNTLFFHLPFHPRGLQHKTIQQLHQQHVAAVMPDCKLTVAVSRPKNLSDRVCSTKLCDVPNNNPSTFISGGDRQIPISFAQRAKSSTSHCLLRPFWAKEHAIQDACRVSTGLRRPDI